jgi:hypothetical protein
MSETAITAAADDYERIKKEAAARRRPCSLVGREIGPLPPVRNGRSAPKGPTDKKASRY